MRQRVAKNTTKTSQAALKKATQEVKTNLTKLNKLITRGTAGKAQLRAAKLLDQLKTAEAKALAQVAKTEKKLEAKTKADLKKALQRFEKSWLSQRSKKIVKQVKAVEKAALLRVKTVEKRVAKQAALSLIHISEPTRPY